jgi:hypothetical protein
LNQARPFGLIGFLHGLEANTFDSLLGRHNLTVLNDLSLHRLDTSFIDAETIWHFYNGQPAEDWMDLAETEETKNGHLRVIEAEEEEQRQ